MNVSLSLPGRPAFDARLATALACSLAAHAALLAGILLLVGLGASGRDRPFDGEPLRARLAAPVAVVAAPVAAPPEAPPAPAPASTAAVPVPLPLPRVPAAPAPAVPEAGSVTIAADESAPLDATAEQRLAESYPAARRGLPDFEVAPQGHYPAAARANLLQALLHVVVVVKEDGSVEAVHGGVDDPVFGEAVRAALAGARARPPLVDGEPRPLWAVLSFYFEGYGSGESLRTLHERR